MRNERRTSGSGKGAAETCAGNRASAPRPHFHWRRYKSFWRGQFAEGHDPGLTYDRLCSTRPRAARNDATALLRNLSAPPILRVGSSFRWQSL